MVCKFPFEYPNEMDTCSVGAPLHLAHHEESFNFTQCLLHIITLTLLVNYMTEKYSNLPSRYNIIICWLSAKEKPFQILKQASVSIKSSPSNSIIQPPLLFSCKQMPQTEFTSQATSVCVCKEWALFPYNFFFLSNIMLLVCNNLCSIPFHEPKPRA